MVGSAVTLFHFSHSLYYPYVVAMWAVVLVGLVGYVITAHKPVQCENQSVWDSLAILSEINQLHNKTRELQTQLESLAKDCVKPCKEGVCANESDKSSVCIGKEPKPVESETKTKRTRKEKPTETT